MPARGAKRPDRARSSSPSSTGSATGSAIPSRRRASWCRGGSAANLTAIACAREALDRADVAADRDVHRRPDALVRGAGGPPPRLPARPAPGPADRRRLPHAARPTSSAAIDADSRPAACRSSSSPTPGTTNTGAVDPICASSPTLCHDAGVWLHVDGAYGAFAVLTERGRGAHAGPGARPTRSRSTRTSGSRCPSRSAA